MLAFLLPAPVLGAGLIAVWSGEPTRALYASAAILVIGYVARYAVIGIRAATAVISQSPVQFEQAAVMVGASYARRLMRIVVPANGRGIVAVALLALVFCLRDFDMAVLYYPPGLQPLPVRIFTLEANGAPSVVAALAVSHVLLTALACVIGLRLIFWRRST
jgi:iron(III) transport system permease protein